MNKIIDHFGDQISAFQNNEHIDICAIGCSKGEGIEVIKKHFHVKEEDMCAIGDSFNDLPMFPHVKYSFTFNYSDDEVKRHAKYIVSSIADCINLLLVNEK